MSYVYAIEPKKESQLHLPPKTSAFPLKSLLKLVTMMSTYGRTFTLTKLPIVSSMTIINPCLSANLRNSTRLGDCNRGFEGNSQNRDGNELAASDEDVVDARIFAFKAARLSSGSPP